MKYYWIASTIEIKTQATKNTLCASKMRGEGNMPLNNVNVGKRFLPTQKSAFRQQPFPNFRLSAQDDGCLTAIMLNKLRFLMSAFPLIEINMCFTAMP